MRNYRVFLLVLVSILVIAGCASTRMTSFRDPGFADQSFQRLIVVAPFTDMEWKTQTEEAFSVRFARFGVQVVPSMEVLLPTRTYKDEELVKLLNQNKIDGVLFLRVTDAYTKQAYIPPSSYTYGQGTVTEHTLSYSATTQQYGGHYISKPRVKFEIRLYDVSTGKVAWVATSLTRGNAFAKFDTLISSLADTTVEKLKEDGLLRQGTAGAR